MPHEERERCERAEVNWALRDELWKTCRRYQMEHDLSTEELLGDIETLKLQIWKANFQECDEDEEDDDGQELQTP